MTSGLFLGSLLALAGEDGRPADTEVLSAVRAFLPFEGGARRWLNSGTVAASPRSGAAGFPAQPQVHIGGPAPVVALSEEDQDYISIPCTGVDVVDGAAVEMTVAGHEVVVGDGREPALAVWLIKSAGHPAGIAGPWGVRVLRPVPGAPWARAGWESAEGEDAMASWAAIAAWVGRALATAGAQYPVGDRAMVRGGRDGWVIGAVFRAPVSAPARAPQAPISAPVLAPAATESVYALMQKVNGLGGRLSSAGLCARIGAAGTARARELIEAAKAARSAEDAAGMRRVLGELAGIIEGRPGQAPPVVPIPAAQAEEAPPSSLVGVAKALLQRARTVEKDGKVLQKYAPTYWGRLEPILTAAKAAIAAFSPSAGDIVAQLEAAAEAVFSEWRASKGIPAPAAAAPELPEAPVPAPALETEPEAAAPAEEPPALPEVAPAADEKAEEPAGPPVAPEELAAGLALTGWASILAPDPEPVKVVPARKPRAQAKAPARPRKGKAGTIPEALAIPEAPADEAEAVAA